MTEPIDQAVPVPPPEPPYGIPPEPVSEPAGARQGPGLLRRFGGGLGNVIGQAFGALVLFPLLVGCVFAGFALLGGPGSPYEQAFVVGAGLGALFGAFVLAVRWFWALFVNFWPVILVIVGIVVAWKALT